MMMKFLRVVASLLIIILISCNSTQSSVIVNAAPHPPKLPKIEKTEMMDQKDKSNLADFFRKFNAYNLKLEEWKKLYR